MQRQIKPTFKDYYDAKSSTKLQLQMYFLCKIYSKTDDYFYNGFFARLMRKSASFKISFSKIMFRNIDHI